VILALVGNQNCGKTTLFNKLTGANQRTGNFPGVTVEQKQGDILGHRDAALVDLPGIYSLTSYTDDEIVSRDFLLNSKPDGIINIVDATNIERNLYLTMQLMELEIPIILALNMMDEVQSNKGSVDILRMRDELGIPVVPISAAKNQGLSELTEQAIETVRKNRRPLRTDFCSKSVHRAIHATKHLIEDHTLVHGIPNRFAATKLLEGDGLILSVLKLGQNEVDMIEHIACEMESELNTDRKAAIVDMRYQFIETVCKNCVVKPKESREYRRSVRLDSILTNKYLAIPSFLAIMFTVFGLTFGIIGRPLTKIVEYCGDSVINLADRLLTAYELNPVMKSLIVDGILSGITSVLGFVPIVTVLFFFLSLLEDSGYMARVAFIMDKPLRKIGLSGRSFVPLLMGFGCSVPAIMATRTLASRRDKKMTVLLTPFMSCGAKIPIYALFTAAFFPKYQAFVMMGIYLTGIILAVFSAIIMNKTAFRGDPVPFVLELPNYRFPSFKSVLFLMKDKAKDFLQKVFTVIFLASIIIWILKTFDTKLNIVTESGDSILASFGRLIMPVFKPLGFNDWRIPTSLLTGFVAKESVVSTLSVLGGDTKELFTTVSALSFLAFTLLYTPCIAAIAAVRRELEGLKWTFFVIAYQTAFAWFIAFTVYRLAVLLKA